MSPRQMPVATGSSHQDRGAVRRSSYMAPLWASPPGTRPPAPLRPAPAQRRARRGVRVSRAGRPEVGSTPVTGPTAPGAEGRQGGSEAEARPATTPPPDAQPPVRHPEAPAPGTLLGSHYDHCFGCGPQQVNGLQLEARAGEGVEVTAEFTVKPVHQGGPGLAHGGVLMSAMDEAMGSLNWILHTASVTGRL